MGCQFHIFPFVMSVSNAGDLWLVGQNIYGVGVGNFAIGCNSLNAAMTISSTGSRTVGGSITTGPLTTTGSISAGTLSVNGSTTTGPLTTTGSITATGNMYANGSLVATLNDINNITGGSISAFNIPNFAQAVQGLGYYNTISNATYATDPAKLIYLVPNARSVSISSAISSASAASCFFGQAIINSFLQVGPK